MAILNYNEQELCLKSYFGFIKKYNKFATSFAVGMLVTILGLTSMLFTSGSAFSVFLLLAGLGLSGITWVQMSNMRKQLLTADEMKQVWGSVTEKLRKRALQKLGVDDDMLAANEQLFISPKILDKDGKDLLFVKDEHDNLYYSLLDICLLGVTKNYLSFYEASVDLQNGEIFNENTDEWFLEDIMAPCTRGYDLSNLDSIGTIDAASLPMIVKKPKAKDAFLVAILKEPAGGWQKNLTIKNFDLFTKSSEVVAVKKSTGLDLFVIENKNGKRLQNLLLSEDFLEQMGATNSQNTSKIVTAVKSMIRNKRS